jgi:UDP-N-acetylmuramoyl-L-alanyl-D-glutamate--2,6-diaminopimelate ligase
MELRDIVALLDATCLGEERPGEIGDLAVNALEVERGDLFFCVRGFGVDGHDWAAEAVANGALAVVAERQLDLAAPLIVVADARTALATVADEFWGRPTETLPVVGVTGTSGKTTTAYLLHSILDAAGRRPGLHSTVETQIGSVRTRSQASTPVVSYVQRTFRSMLDAGNRSCAMEVTSYDAELRRLDGIRFAALVFTNLGHDHLDQHETMERYFAAKRRLFFEDVPPAVVNLDDSYGQRLYSELRAAGRERVLSFGRTTAADISPGELELSAEGARIRVGELELCTRLLGAFNVENVLAAVAAARLLDVPDDAIAAGVLALDRVPGRTEPVDEGQPFAVFVDYAHKPEALEAVLRTARTLAEGRVICVFGCGGDSYRGKRPMMGRIASSLADYTVVTTDNPRDEDPSAIVEEILEGGLPELVEPDRRRAIEHAIELARPGDVIVVAGRGHETRQKVAGGRTEPFDDREIVRDVLRERFS